MRSRRTIARVILWITVAVACLIAFLLPLSYFIISYQHMIGSLETEADITANIISREISRNPKMWRYEEIILEEMLSRRPKIGYVGTLRIIDDKNEVVATSGAVVKAPFITKTREIMDSGLVVGRIEIRSSLHRLLIQTGLAALVGLSIGFAVFITLRVLPLRAVFKAEEALQKAHDELEIRVRERTTELDKANRVLQIEITERKRAEEEILKLNAELELKVEKRTKQLVDAQEELVRKEKLAILGQLAGGVGHELRNPLGVISNAIYFLKTVMPDADETTKEYMDIIKDEVDNSQRIISDLLDFSRTKTPQTSLVTIGELITQSLKKCKVPENVTVEADIPETLPGVIVDPLQMWQVFHNLIINAVQAMPDGGTLEIKAEDDREANVLRISVSDTGQGISPEDMEKLFQPLFTTKARGIGLGLVVSKRLTEANGGRIEAESQLGKGTTFTVILPIKGKDYA